MADASGSGAGAEGALRVGRALRECREAYGRSLDDVAEATRIRRAYLDALEQGRYDEFPGEFWARLFLKSYAQHLGLPPEEILGEAFGDGPAPPPPRPQAWERGMPSDRVEPVPAAAVRADYRPRARGRGAEDRTRRSAKRLSDLGPRSTRRQWASPLWGAVAAIIVAALLAGIIYNFVHQSAPAAALGGHSTGAGKTAGTGKTAGSSHAGAGHSHTGGAASSTGGQTAGAGKGQGGAKGSTASAGGHGYTTVAFDQATSRATYRAAGSRVALHLTFQGPCWVGVSEGASKALVINRVYAAGQSLDLTVRTPVKVTLGASWRASGTLNGQTIGPWTGGRVWKLAIDP